MVGCGEHCSTAINRKQAPATRRAGSLNTRR